MSLLLKQLADALILAIPRVHRHLVSDEQFKQMKEAARAYEAVNDSLDLSAAEILVHAYARGESRGGSIDWDDLNRAWLKAKDEIGPERCGEIEDCYKEEDDESSNS